MKKFKSFIFNSFLFLCLILNISLEAMPYPQIEYSTIIRCEPRGLNREKASGPLNEIIQMLFNAEKSEGFFSQLCFIDFNDLSVKYYLAKLYSLYQKIEYDIDEPLLFLRDFLIFLSYSDGGIIDINEMLFKIFKELELIKRKTLEEFIEDLNSYSGIILDKLNIRCIQGKASSIYDKYLFAQIVMVKEPLDYYILLRVNGSLYKINGETTEKFVNEEKFPEIDEEKEVVYGFYNNFKMKTIVKRNSFVKIRDRLLELVIC